MASASSAGALERPIGYFVSPDREITFYEDSQHHIVATVDASQEAVPVKLPPLKGDQRLDALRTKEKVHRALISPYWCPTYSPPAAERGGKIAFKPIAIKSEPFGKYAEVSIPESALLKADPLHNVVDYCYLNTVTSWRLDNRYETHLFPNMGKITVICRLLSGELLVGDEFGRLSLEDGRPFLVGNQSLPADSLIPIGDSFCLVGFEKFPDVILDLAERKIVLTLNESYKLLRNGTVALLKENRLVLLRLNGERRAYETIEHPLKDQKVESFRKISDTLLILFPDKETDGLFFDLRDNSLGPVEGLSYKQYQSFDCRPLQDGSFAFWYRNENSNPTLTFYSRSPTESKYSPQESLSLKSWGITAVMALSDGSLLIATDTTPSYFHLVSPNKKDLFSFKIDNNLRATDLEELNSGFVVVRAYKSFVVFQRPCRSATEDCSVEDLAIDGKKEHHLSHLIQAIKVNDVYRARRSYEKARQLDPDDPIPCEIFLSYLDHLPYIKLQRRVSLDLYGIRPDPTLITPLAPCKRRLFIGEGTFTYTEAFVKKHEISHPNLAKAIVATELEQAVDDPTRDRVAKLMKQGVTVLFGIDGKKIHERFATQRFQRIQWNCPFGCTTDQARAAFKSEIPQFFLSAAQLQIPHDRIHVTLVQQKDPNSPQDIGYWSKRRQLENPIVFGATQVGYRLIRKRSFGASRYPGYVHTKTGSSVKYTEGGSEREFVFEKIGFPVPPEVLEKRFSIKSDNPQATSLQESYFDCSTDEDSSDCGE